MATTSSPPVLSSRSQPSAVRVRPIPVATRRFWRRVALGVGVLLAAMGLGLSTGAAEIPLTDLVRILVSRVPRVATEQSWPLQWERIVWDIRLPRVLLAGLVGATLAFAGATYQGVLRNPLADPYLIGVAAGAGLGATLAFLLPVQFSFYALSPVPIFAFLGAMTAVTTAYRLAKIGTRVPTTTLILAGVAISSLASAAMLFLFMLAGDNLRAIFSWIMGSLNASTWGKVHLLVPYTVVMALVVLVHGRLLNVLQVNEEQAQQLGVNVERVKIILVASASIGTAAAVSVSGLIGFVGLMVPHMVRMVWGADYRTVLPLSLLYGAAFLIVADLVARTVISPGEMPVGVVTAFCGAPFFLVLLRRARGTYL